MNRLTLLVSFTLVLAGAIGVSTQELLYTLTSWNEQAQGRFGGSVSCAGDVNNDGYDDIVVGARREAATPSPDGAGHAYVFSGDGGSLLYTLISPNKQLFGWFGCSVSGVGDVDNDGYDDVAVGAPFENPGASPEHAGRAYVFSGRTAATLHTLVSPNEAEHGYFGWVVSGAGDVDSDGYEDIAVGASLFDPWLTPPGGEGRAYIFGGRTGALLYTLVSPEDTTGYFGNAVSGVGDVDADGRADVVVGAWYEDGEHVSAGRAYVFSGQTGDVLYTLASPNDQTEGRFGAVVSEAGDVDGDGCSDIIVGSLEDPSTGPKEAGRVYVFSGATGTLVHTLVSPSDEAGGWFAVVSGVGDVDQDGYADVLVGAPNEDPDPGLEDAGRVHLFSGATGETLCTLRSPNEERDPSWPGNFGISISGVGDNNGDGYPDVVVGAPGENPVPAPDDAGRAYVFSLAPPTRVPSRVLAEPRELLMHGPVPNPVGGHHAWLGLRAPQGGEAHVRLSLYDARGRRIAVVVEETLQSGERRDVCWNPERRLPSGVYWWRLQAEGHEAQRPMVLAR